MKNLGSILQLDTSQQALIDLSDPEHPRSYSFFDLQRLANGVASSLEVGRATRIGILARNSVEYLAILLGIMRAGGIAVPINYKFPDATIHYIVADAALPIIFADEHNAGRLSAKAAQRLRPCRRRLFMKAQRVARDSV